MKIISLVVENFKKIKAVQITPKGNMITISGQNGSGKTSVLDAIFAALKGAEALPSEPVRRGADRAIIKLDLGDVVVTRRFTNKGTSLSVEGTDGSEFRSPQKMLDNLLGKLAFDPLEFMRLGPNQQLEQLRSLVHLDVDLDALDRANQADYDSRTFFNREAKQLDARISATPSIAYTPDPPQDVATLLEQLEVANDLNQQTALENSDMENRKLEAQRLQNTVVGLEGRAQRLRSELSDVERQIVASNDKAREILAEVAAFKHGEPIDTTEMRREIAQAQDQQRVYDSHRRNVDARSNLQRELDAAKAKSAQLTKNIAKRDERKRTAITSAHMPVEGLGFGSGEVLYNGLPLTQASDAEQLRISTAIAMAMNPKLRVLRIRDGSLLDSKSLRVLEDMLNENDYQAWVERVSDDGKIGIVMEDGAVRE